MRGINSRRRAHLDNCEGYRNHKISARGLKRSTRKQDDANKSENELVGDDENATNERQSDNDVSPSQCRILTANVNVMLATSLSQTNSIRKSSETIPRA